ncbi:hypothetical protein B0H13DRAFT_1655241 [Mycena leptocephala]|nr:hypothetical protein B0H13DRAFT_1655241 [Mycena leptocephala]
MPTKKGGLWKYYHQGEKQNSHFKAYCLGCINVHRPASAGSAADPMEVNSDNEDQNVSLGGEWFTAGKSLVYSSMITHLISTNCCLNASKEARAEARKLAGKSAAAEDVGTDGDDESDAGAPAVKKRKHLQAVEKSFKQSQLKVFKGIDIPFTQVQANMIATQFLRVTISLQMPAQKYPNGC